MDEAAPSPPPDAVLSISRLARIHRRERLLVPPIQWTGRHLQLLRCSFGAPRRAPARTRGEPLLFGPQGTARLRFVYNRHGWILAMRRDALVNLLAVDGLFEARKGLSFSFNRRHVQTLRCTVLASTTLQGLPLIAACLDLEDLPWWRYDIFKVPVEMNWCKSLHSLSRLKIKNITPKTPLHDPYIVAILIALAQKNATLQHIITSQVLASSKDHCVHLYRARISSFLLRSLDDPAFNPPEPMSISIDITTIPCRPLRSLRHRLVTLLLPNQELIKIHQAYSKGESPQHQPALRDEGQSITYNHQRNTIGEHVAKE